MRLAAGPHNKMSIQYSHEAGDALGEYVSLETLAHRYECSVRTIRRQVSEGRIPAFRLPGSRLLRVRLADADAALRPLPTAGGGR